MNILQKIFDLLTHKKVSPNNTESIYIKKNYFVFLSGSFLTQIADALSSTKTVLVWIMNGLGVPVFITSLLVPIRESGSMLPQIFLAPFISKQSKRLPLWILGAGIQSISLVVIGVASLYLEGTLMGIIALLMVAVLSFGRSFCSLCSKDIMGRTIPKNIRGSLTGNAQALSGVVILSFGLWLQYTSLENTLLSYVVIIAGVIWFFGIILYSYLHEPRVHDNDKKESKNILYLLGLLKTDKVLRKFIIARSLLLCSALTTPFYVILAQESGVDSLGVLGFFIMVTGIAGVISSPLWGYFADISSKKVMAYAGAISSILAFIVILLPLIYSSLGSSWIFYTLVIFLVTVAHNGVRVGRKTYIVNCAEGNDRINYISTSNSVIAAVLIIVGIISSLFSLISISWALGILGVMGLLGSYLSYHLADTIK